MNNIFLIICSIILSPFLANKITPKITPKLCINCKFFTKDFFNDNKFGKCLLFPTLYEDDYFLVNGINNNNNKIQYNYCSISRKYKSMCGEEGKFYEKK